MRKWWLGFILIALSAWTAHAQKDANTSKKVIVLSGKITSAVWPDTLGKGIKRGLVEAYVDGKKIAMDSASTSGQYKFKKIPYYPSIQLIFKAEGHLQKIIDVDLTEFGDDGSQQMQLEMDVVLYRDYQFIGVNFLKTRPFGKGKYSIKKKMIIWDIAYKEEMRNRLDQILKAYSDDN
jgi:hypothetical protein